MNTAQPAAPASADAPVPSPAPVKPSEQSQDALDRAKGHGVLLFDGDCAMCNGFVQRFIAMDPTQALRYAPLQGSTAAEIFQRHGIRTQDSEKMLSGVRLVQNFRQENERVLAGSDAALTALSLTSGPARQLHALMFIPRFIREWVYNKIAQNRYRIAGKMQQCAIPQPNQRHLFLP
ncbi:MAG TPA: DCC1-like thiol-disulfide oxidoreductase family protein [Candidatus Methylacidiphilales bacterium]|nr:DCC1-like thiol-disulfide oxidoreductase family protein [Candidatus Methylacidiphilales bacterium]